MPSESLIRFAGTPTRGLSLTVSCPTCGGVLTFTNGVRRSVEDVGIAGIAILACPKHGSFEVQVHLLRSTVARPKRPSGAQQRRKAKERSQEVHS